MQQELIEMLDKMVDHVVFCNGHEQRFSSTGYGIKILEEAGELLEKAKKSVNQTAVPYEASLSWGGFNLYGDRKSIDEVMRLKHDADTVPELKQAYRAALSATPAAPSQPVTLTDDEMWSLWNPQGIDEMNQSEAIAFARVVIAALREKGQV